MICFNKQQIRIPVGAGFRLVATFALNLARRFKRDLPAGPRFPRRRTQISVMINPPGFPIDASLRLRRDQMKTDLRRHGILAS